MPDGVGYDWVDGLKAYAEAEVSDAQFAARAERFPFNPPENKEYYLLRSIFEEYYPGKSALDTVPFGKSIACRCGACRGSRVSPPAALRMHPAAYRRAV